MSDEATSTSGPSGPEGAKPSGTTAPGAAGENDQGKNPLGDEQRAFSEAYQNGQRFLSQEIMAQYGPSATIGQADIGEMQVGDRTQIFIGHTLSHTAGAVREEVLTWIRARYLEVDRHDLMLKTLRSRRVIVLRGQPGTGRVTTALHLLDTVAEGRVFRLDSGETITSLTEAGITEGNGYVAELSRRLGNVLTEAHLDKMRDLYEKAEAFCVLVVDADFRHDDLFGGYAFTCLAPDPGSLLRRHADHEARAQDMPDFEDRVSELLETNWVSDALGPCPRPLESVRMAALLAEHVRGKLTEEDVRYQAAQAISYQITEWFAALQAAQRGDELDEALRLAAFRIALAVLNESSYHLVAEAAGQLSAKLIAAIGGRHIPRTPLFSDDPEGRLPALRAKMIDGYAMFSHVRVPMRMLAFQDERYPIAILRYVWENHHRMRAVIALWLKKLCRDDKPVLWVRAAQATGYVCGLDPLLAYREIILPAAETADTKRDFWVRRMSAAIALGQAADGADMRPAIRERLRYWRRYGSPALRWSAAAVHGLATGRWPIEESLDELRILGTPSEQRLPMDQDDDLELVWISAYSVARLLAFGEVWPVLDRLKLWIHSERSSVRRLAVYAMAHLIGFYGFELDYLWVSAGSARPLLPEGADRWPLLLALQAQDPGLTEPIADLLRQLFRVREGSIARDSLGKWIRAGARDAKCLDVLVGLLPHIVELESDAHRLGNLVDRMRRDWADPLRDEVVKQLDEAILMASVRSVVS